MVIILLVLITIFPFFFISLSSHPTGPLSQLNSFGHFAFFAFFALFLSRLTSIARLSIYWQTALVITVILLLGGFIELTQSYFDRTASWRDMGVNLLGGFGGLLFLSPVRYSLPRVLKNGLQISVLGLCIFLFSSPVITLLDMYQANRHFPVLSDFETRFEADRWSRGVVDHSVARHGNASLRVYLDTDRFSGTKLTRSFGNWQGYSALAFSIHNPDPQSLSLILSIRDLEHSSRGSEYDDRFNYSFEISQGWNDLKVPLTDIENAPAERTLNLKRLTDVVIFATNLPEPRTINLDHVRLIP